MRGLIDIVEGRSFFTEVEFARQSDRLIDALRDVPALLVYPRDGVLAAVILDITAREQAMKEVHGVARAAGVPIVGTMGRTNHDIDVIRDIRGAFETVERKDLTESYENPDRFYHGTNFIAAAKIVADGQIDAVHPVDDDDLGPVVCVTTERRLGRMFAIEFVRENSRHEIGAVFELDATAIRRDIEAVPHEAETAGSEFEYEYRIKGDIDLSKYLIGIQLVGDIEVLDNPDDLDDFVVEVWDGDEEARRLFVTPSRFAAALLALIESAG